ncbi:hypothetical protein Tco_0978435 [Tanacetum coccineum]|uniref:Uncharacterized protein n=1 Tax=Tanacetum coccineum TaxID=301880 RepID=A0ABQ5EMX0_9ASTR
MAKGKGKSLDNPFVAQKSWCACTVGILILLFSGESTNLKLSSSLDDNVSKEGPSKATVSREGPSKEFLKWYEDATDEDTTDDSFFLKPKGKTVEKNPTPKCKGKAVERTNNPTPTVIFKSPIPIEGCMLGLVNVKTWDNIVKKFGMRTPESCADKANGKRKVALKWRELMELEDSGDNSLFCKHLCLRIKMDQIIWERFKVIVHGSERYIGFVPFDEEPFDTDAGRECGDTVNVNATDEDSDVNRFFESSFVHENVSMHGTNNIPSEEKTHSDDPFKIYEILNWNNENTGQSRDDKLQYPLGFIHVDKDVEECEIQNNVDPEHNVTSSSNNKTGSFNDSSTQSEFHVLECSRPWSQGKKDGSGSYVNQEVSYVFGNLAFPSKTMLQCLSDYFVAIMGTWLPTSSKLLVNYAPQELTEKGSYGSIFVLW